MQRWQGWAGHLGRVSRPRGRRWGRLRRRERGRRSRCSRTSCCAAAAAAGCHAEARRELVRRRRLRVRGGMLRLVELRRRHAGRTGGHVRRNCHHLASSAGLGSAARGCLPACLQVGWLDSARRLCAGQGRAFGGGCRRFRSSCGSPLWGKRGCRYRIVESRARRRVGPDDGDGELGQTRYASAVVARCGHPSGDRRTFRRFPRRRPKVALFVIKDVSSSRDTGDPYFAISQAKRRSERLFSGEVPQAITGMIAGRLSSEEETPESVGRGTPENTMSPAGNPEKVGRRSPENRGWRPLFPRDKAK